MSDDIVRFRSRVRNVVSINANGSKRVRIMFDFPSKTDQSFKKDCDINLIVRRFIKQNRLSNLGFINYMTSNCPNFDPSGIVNGSPPDYQDHLQAQLDADAMFMSIPSSIRKRFNNDAVQFLDFVYKPENRAELASMGLLKPEAVKRLKDAQTAISTPSLGSSSTDPLV